MRARRAPRRRARACGSGHGFTLLEMLVVLMLMGIIASVVIPIFGPGVSTLELKRSARELAAGLRLARSQAIAQRTEAVLELDLAGRSFRVPPDPRLHSLPQGVELKLFTAQSDLLNEQVGTVRFFPDGGSNGGRITVAAGDRKYDVDIDWLTGRVAILE
ncbi:MAG TPA: GspH/FimT family pseudopilin [Casimicrobiaceae bacterium]|nr:GspH/FimT family pseudopilin [Casimicrobiaceae bacterium]